ncbi:hypothetical protein [Sabulibacter ruber]|uniref:hypothetical protein n=1 Tax=Sabulibacter ruber TaxID=2811901 RepID=UPI001A95C892|nr:hypothetical protein [Sabulibacter ruber]
MKNCFTLLVFTFFLLIVGNASAQSSATAFLSERGDISFKVEKTDFHILLSQEGKITGYAIKANGEIDYDIHGRVRKIGQVEIAYDIHGRINKIGSEEISYNIDGRLTKIGRTEISYSFFNGKIASIRD